jgi:translocation and assembly module TamA
MKYLQLILILIFLSVVQNSHALILNSIDDNVNLNFVSSENAETLRTLMEKSIKQKRQENKNLDIDHAINKKARKEKEIIDKLLRSEGFYSSKTSYDIENKDITYNINAGKPYTIEDINIKSKLNNLPSLNELKLSQGSRFKAKSVLDAINSIKTYIEKNYCLWEIKVDYEATVNHLKNTASISIKVDDSNSVYFGNVSFEGLKTIKESYLKNKLNFNEGECFKRSKIEKARLNLFQTNLISSVDNSIIKKDDKVDVQFGITERKHRTIKASTGVNSDEGVSLSLGWEHRNLFGKAQKLEANARVSEIYRKADTSLTIPYFLNNKQSLILKGEIGEENLEAFDARSISASAIINRKLGKHLLGSIGTKLKITSVEENEEDETFGLVSFPLSLSYDKRDDVLNAKKGWYLSGEISPFIDTFDTRTSFVKTSIGASAYHTPENFILSPTFAVRAAIGSINGQNTDDIPADERFYVGGGGSVRGYPFQKLGPLELEKPTGGSSFSEISFESRFKFSKDWGGVLFLDGGNAYEDTTPDFGKGIRWAYGLGARYYTDFAPLRLDVAFPLEARDGIDDNFQFYISIGQAF